MKKILILIICMLPVIAFSGCNDKDEIRKDIDGLNARLDALNESLEGLNTSIRSFQDVMKGLVLVTSYKIDERGNYTLSLSDGTELLVYGGQPIGEIPTVGVNEAGNWTYTLDNKTVELKDPSGKPYSAKPTDGVDGGVPQISIDAEGYWCYSVNGAAPKRVEGRYNLAHIGDIPASIFANVAIDGNKIQFTFPGETTPTEILLLGGLDMTFSAASVTVAKEGTAKLTATQIHVDAVTIDPTPLQVVLSDDASDNLSISAVGVDAGNYTVHFQIFSAEGYRLIKSLNITVTE